MRHRSFNIMMLVLIGVSFLCISSVYAETAEEYYNSGVAYGNQGNFTQAISNFKKAIEINPNYAEAYCDDAMLFLVETLSGSPTVFS